MGALQDFHKWRCMRLVHAEVFAKVDRAVWDEVFAKRPDLLQGAPSDSARAVCRKRQVLLFVCLAGILKPAVLFVC